MIKSETRIIGWDDCRFTFHQKHVRIIGAIFRGGQFLDGLLSTMIEKDGLDATDKIAKSINNSRHKDQLKIIMLDGISFAGFNLVDIKALNKKTGMPIIVIQRKRPDTLLFKKTLSIFRDHRKRRRIVDSAGRLYKWGKIFYQRSGLSKNECEDILRISTIRSSIPEPIRVAHLIASGLSGESRGRA